MRVPRPFVLLSLLFVGDLSAQQTLQQVAPRDPQAIAILQKSVSVMGGVVPADSVATGTVEIIAGSSFEKGTVRILTRGRDQSVEQIQTPEGLRAEVFSRGLGSEKQGAVGVERSLEWAATSRSFVFPLPLIADDLNSVDTAYQYLGLETLNGLAVHHVRTWRAFASKPKLKHLEEFTVRDLWLDTASGLPLKFACVRRAARGAEPGFPLEVFYSDYRNVGGLLYPHRIEKHLNGTPWTTILIQTVAFNIGLADAEFSVR